MGKLIPLCRDKKFPVYLFIVGLYSVFQVRTKLKNKHVFKIVSACSLRKLAKDILLKKIINKNKINFIEIKKNTIVFEKVFNKVLNKVF